MPTKILADFTGYGSAMAAVYGGYLIAMLLATLVLLLFARSCHILLKNRLTVSYGKSVSIWPTVIWAVIGVLIVLGPSFIYDFGTSNNFSHPQDIFRFSLGVLAIVWWKRLGSDSPLGIEKYLILWWGVFTIAVESITLIRIFALPRVLHSDIRETYFMIVSFQRFFNTLAMLLVVLLIYSQTLTKGHNNQLEET